MVVAVPKRIPLKKALPILRKNTKTLKNLDLCGCNVDEEGAIDLAEALKNNTVLEVLSLLENTIEEGGAEAIA